MALRVYAYKNCGTCRKAVKWLQENSIAYTEIPIREQPPTVAELKRVLKAVDGNIRKLFNTSGQAYKANNIKEVLPNLSDEEALAMLADDGNLVKRPVVIGKSVALVGFKEEDWKEALS
jgi:Spx/MgsR family transcriptional regulator